MSKNLSGKRVLVTSGLPYPNGRLHVGHIAGAYLPADIYVRYLRLRGRDVRFVCGSDDHGVAIMLAAQKEGKTPQQVADYYHDLQLVDFTAMGVNFDVFGSTSRTKFHAPESQRFFLELYKKGCFEKESARQFYDPAREMFLPDRFVKGECGYCATKDQYGDQCEQCGKLLDVDTLKNAVSVFSGEAAIIKESTHWFLDLSKFADEVKAWLKVARLRDHTRAYVEGLLSVGLVRRAMTRDITWGVPVPLEEAKGKVLYVWFDAPIGYIANTMQMCELESGDESAYRQWWSSEDSEIVHFIGEDNTIFHCVVWIAMLSAEGSYRLPTSVVVNQYMNIQVDRDSEAQKISKSRGVGVWIGDYIAAGGNPDSLRYYLTAIAPERSKSVYRSDDLVQRHNSELGNILGNFAQRIVTFCHKNFAGTVPQIALGKFTELDKNFIAKFGRVVSDAEKLYENHEAKAALERVMEFARECNKYIDDKAPWVTRKTDLEATAVSIATSLRALALLVPLMAPIIPFTAEKLARILGGIKVTWPSAVQLGGSGVGDSGEGLLAAGHKLGEAEVLFPKIEYQNTN